MSWYLVLAIDVVQTFLLVVFMFLFFYKRREKEINEHIQFLKETAAGHGQSAEAHERAVASHRDAIESLNTVEKSHQECMELLRACAAEYRKNVEALNLIW